MKLLKYNIFILILIALTINVYAEETWIGRTGAQILRINPSTQSMALGGGFIAKVSGVKSNTLNPAGITGIKRREVAFSHVEMFEGMRVEYLGYGQKYKSLYFVIDTKGYMDSITARDSEGDKAGEKSVYAVAPSLGLGIKMMEHLKIGVSATGFYQSYETVNNKDLNLFLWAFNAGFQLSIYHDTVNIGATARNLSSSNASLYSDSSKTPMPLIGNAGVSYTYKDENLNDKVIVSADIEIPYEKAYVPSMGVEYIVKNWLSLRGGYRLNEDYEDTMSNLTFGLTIEESVKEIYGSLDYAYYSYEDLGSTHRVSYSIKW